MVHVLQREYRGFSDLKTQYFLMLCQQLPILLLSWPQKRLQIKLRRQYNGFAALSVEKRQKGLNINLLAVVRLDQGFTPGMPKQDLGAIIHISSIQDKSINVNQQAIVKVLNTTRQIGVTNGDLF